MSEDQKIKYLLECIALIQTQNEDFGIVPLEAMASGTPVVSLAARLEGLKLENGQHIAVVENAEEFVSTINELLGDLSKRVKLSKGARALVEREYSWKIIGNNLANIWKNL